MHRRASGNRRHRARELVANELEQAVERRPVVDGHVVDLVDGIGARRRRREQVRLHRVADVAEVAAGLAVAVDDDLVAGQQRPHPARDHRRVGALRVLPLAEDVEVAQPGHLQPVAAGEHVGVELVDELGHRVRRQRPADDVLDLGQCRMVAVGRARRRVDEAPDAGVARGHEHVEKAVDVGAVGRDRIGERARHRPQRRLVQHDVDAAAGLAARGEVANVAFDEAVSRPLRHGDARLDLVDVPTVAGGEVVETHHGLVEPQQSLDQVRADEPRAARHQPATGLGYQLRMYALDAHRESRPRRSGFSRDRPLHTESPSRLKALLQSAPEEPLHLTAATP